MPTEISVRAVYEGGLRMSCQVGSTTITTDYPLKPGDPVAGPKPMELLLACLGACGGSVVGSLLRRMKQPVDGVEVDVRGQRRDEHPTVFTSIAVEFTVRGAGVDPAAVQRVITEADEHLCPVWAMLKPGTPISTSFRVIA